MSRKVLNVATFGLAGALFGGGKKKAPAPTPAPDAPAVMPVADDSRILQARKRSIIRQRARRGRESTILTGETLGG